MGNQFNLVFNFNTPFESDSGKYLCRVRNVHGEVKSKIVDIQIKDPMQTDLELDDSIFQTKPRFIEYFSDVYMEQGTEAQFKCKIMGKPEPKVTWYCNCRKLTSNEKFELIKDESDHYTLIVKNVNFNDEGEYTCKASNVKGETSWSANLYLNESLGKKTTQSDPSSSLIAPNFIRKIKDSTVSEGQDARLDCFIDGEPFPTIKWFRNNSPIDLETNKDKYQVDVDEESGKVSFTIFKCEKPKDEDEYLIKIENSAGVSQCSAYLAVEASKEDSNKLKRKVRFSLPKDSDVFIIPSNETETPRPPGEPVISEYNTTSLILTWPASPSDINHYEKPDRDLDSQSNVTYIVEYRSSRSYAWSVYASNVESLTHKIGRLTPGLTYSFKVNMILYSF